MPDIQLQIECLKELNVLYHGEQENPYHPVLLPPNDRELEYLKFHIWYIERELFQNYESYWRKSYNPDNAFWKNLDDFEVALEIYKDVVSDRIILLESTGKEYMKMYFELDKEAHQK